MGLASRTESPLQLEIDGALWTRSTFEQVLSGNVTVVSSTAYLSGIGITVVTPSANKLITIQDRQAIPVKLVNTLSAAVGDTVPQTIIFPSPILMTSGIDLVAPNGGFNVWIQYYS